MAVAPATTAPTVRPTRTPEDTIPTRPAAGPVVVYAARVAPVSPGGPWKCELVGFDTGAGAVWSAHEAPVCDYSPVLTGDGRIIFPGDGELGIAGLASTDSTPFYEYPSNREFAGMALSHNGKLLAVALHDKSLYDAGEVVVLHLSQSPVVVHVFHRDDPGLGPPFFGWLSSPQWLGDDSGVMVVGAVPKDGYGARATLFLDGRVQLNENIWRSLSPDGRYAFQSFGPPCPYAFYGKQLTIRDASTDVEVARMATSGDEVVSAVEWAPDSSGLLAAVWTLTPTICSGDAPIVPKYWLLPMAGDAQAVTDVTTLRNQWYGNMAVALKCPHPTPWMLTGATAGFAACNGEEGVLTIGARPAGKAVEVHTLGIIP